MMEAINQRGVQENVPPLNPVYTSALFERSGASTLRTQAVNPEEPSEAEPALWWVWTCKGWDFLYWIVSSAVNLFFCRPLIEASKGIDQQIFREQTSLITAKGGHGQSFLPLERQQEVFSRLPYVFQKEVFDHFQIGSRGNRIAQVIQHTDFSTHFPLLADRFSAQLLVEELKKLAPKLSADEPFDNLDLFQTLCCQNREHLATMLVREHGAIQAKLARINERPEFYMRKEYFSRCLKEYQQGLTHHIGVIEGQLFPDRAPKPKTLDD